VSLFFVNGHVCHYKIIGPVEATVESFHSRKFYDLPFALLHFLVDIDDPVNQLKHLRDDESIYRYNYLIGVSFTR